MVLIITASEREKVAVIIANVSRRVRLGCLEPTAYRFVRLYLSEHYSPDKFFATGDFQQNPYLGSCGISTNMFEKSSWLDSSKNGSLQRSIDIGNRSALSRWLHPPTKKPYSCSPGLRSSLDLRVPASANSGWLAATAKINSKPLVRPQKCSEILDIWNSNAICSYSDSMDENRCYNR